MVIDAKEGKRLMEELGDKVLILDVRHIPNAILIDNDEISSTVKHPALPDDFERPILIYCRSGVRSNYAMKKLQALGYKTVYDMGGILSWPYEIVR